MRVRPLNSEEMLASGTCVQTAEILLTETYFLVAVPENKISIVIQLIFEFCSK